MTTHDTPEGYVNSETYVYRLSNPQPDPRVLVTGTVTVRATEIEVSGWSVEGMDLAALAEYAARWAESRLAEVPFDD